MAFGSVTLQPGVIAELTPTLLKAGYSSSSLIRFRAGLGEKMGGWTKFYPFTVGGIPRSLSAWQDVNTTKHLSIGTTTNWSVLTAGGLQDISPETLTSDFSPNFSTTSGSNIVTIVDANISNVTTYDSIYFNTPIAVGGLVLSGLYPIVLNLGTHQYEITAAANATGNVSNGGAVPTFTTTSGSALVTVTITAHGLSAGNLDTNKVNFPLSTTVGGCTILGTYSVVSVTDANNFTVTAANTASSSAGPTLMNSGNCELVYYIAIGPPAAGTGYSIGGYSSGGYSTGSTSSAQTGTDIAAVDWTTTNWNSLAIGCPQGGALYYWNPNGGFQNASLIYQGPPKCDGCFIAMPQQILVAWGATTYNGIGITQNPLLVAWCDQANFSNWTPSNDSLAGDFAVPTGSKVVGGIQAPQFGLIWTDIDLYAMRFTGNNQLVFAFTQIAQGCGLIGKHAVCVLAGIVYWVNPSNIFKLDGNGVAVVPCSVWDVMFQDLNTTYQFKVVMGANTPFNEFIIHYCSISGGGTENDKYIKYNYVENTWDYGPKANTTPMQRTAWTDTSVLGTPLASTPQGLIYQHEKGYDADLNPLLWSFTTGWFMLAEGEDYVMVDRIYPDFKWGTFAGAQTAVVTVLVEVVNFSGDTPVAFGPYTTMQSTEYISLRCRGRQMRLTFSGSDSGSFVRLGRVRYRFQPDGRR